MVKVNCAANPGTLIESELFGREKARTRAPSPGRQAVRPGQPGPRFPSRDLRPALETQTSCCASSRRGSSSASALPIHPRGRPHHCATNKDSPWRSGGALPQDLFFRLNVFPITLPALRERPEDSPLLAMAIVDELGASMGRQF